MANIESLPGIIILSFSFSFFSEEAPVKLKKNLINYLINNPIIKFGIEKFTPYNFRFEPCDC